MSPVAGFLLSIIASGVAMMLFQGRLRRQVLVGAALIAAIPALEWFIERLPDPCGAQSRWWQSKSGCVTRPVASPITTVPIQPPVKRADRLPLPTRPDLPTATIMTRQPGPARPRERTAPPSGPRLIPAPETDPMYFRPFGYAFERPLCEETPFRSLGMCVEGPNGILMPNQRRWDHEQHLMELRSRNHQ